MSQRANFRITPLMRRIVFLAALALTAVTGAGCSSAVYLSTDGAPRPPASAHASPIIVTTRDQSRITFHDGWQLTMQGIRGGGFIESPDGMYSAGDTTISYFDVASAGAVGRGNTMGQFLLTILGVILVIGLAAIILYQAFIATDR